MRAASKETLPVLTWPYLQSNQTKKSFPLADKITVITKKKKDLQKDSEKGKIAFLLNFGFQILSSFIATS